MGVKVRGRRNKAYPGIMGIVFDDLFVEPSTVPVVEALRQVPVIQSLHERDKFSMTACIAEILSR